MSLRGQIKDLVSHLKLRGGQDYQRMGVQCVYVCKGRGHGGLTPRNHRHIQVARLQSAAAAASPRSQWVTITVLRAEKTLLTKENKTKITRSRVGPRNLLLHAKLQASTQLHTQKQLTSGYHPVWPALVYCKDDEIQRLGSRTWLITVIKRTISRTW